jgi:hypothetical protein
MQAKGIEEDGEDEEDDTLLEYESNDGGGVEIPVVDSDDE